MSMTLFHSPGSCSDGVAFLLEEIGIPYDVQIIDLKSKAQLSPEYQATNPKGKVPALLRPDGSVLTEFQAIAFWLGRSNPQAGLIGPELEEQARMLSMLDYLVASIHMRGFTLLKVPQKFIADPQAQEALRAHGRAEVEKGLANVAEQLGANEYLFGRLSIVDGALFYLLRWAKETGVEMAENLDALHARLMARPAAARALVRR